MEHHEATITNYVEHARAVEDNLAVVVGGSVARGLERTDSDVDVYLVVTEEAFTAAIRDGRMAYVDRTQATYDGGYVDIKAISLSYLEAAADRGDDPMRASLRGARIAWSRIDDLDQRLRPVTELPDEAWLPRQESWLAQVRLHGGYFLSQAVQLDNQFLQAHAAVHLVNAAGRLLLAYNRVFFAGPKYLTAQVAALPSKPVGYEAAASALLAEPTIERSRELVDLLESFQDWPWTREGSLSTFVRDNELSWLNRTSPPEYS